MEFITRNIVQSILNKIKHITTHHNLSKEDTTLLIDKLNKSEIKVLQVLQESNITNDMNAIKISTISEKTGLSYFIVRNIIKSFYIAGICKKGRREGNGETYYLCKGAEMIETKT